MNISNTATPSESVLELFVAPEPYGLVSIKSLDDLIDVTGEGRTFDEAKRDLLAQMSEEARGRTLRFNTYARSPKNQLLMLRAIELASEGHLSQTDKAGEPYLGHPARVAESCETDDERMVGLMHDLIEDTDVTAQTLIDEGFPTHVVEAVVALSRQEGETYDEFIERLAPNPLARRVKIADLLDNMDVTRLPVLTRHDCERLMKYHRAWRRLLVENDENAC